jgi:hypothetical protein
MTYSAATLCGVCVSNKQKRNECAPKKMVDLTKLSSQYFKILFSIRRNSVSSLKDLTSCMYARPSFRTVIRS